MGLRRKLLLGLGKGIREQGSGIRAELAREQGLVSTSPPERAETVYVPLSFAITVFPIPVNYILGFL